ncbi:anti-sigma F factor antagonist [Clostridium sp. CAG:793]|nr:anti-sigma F factor antagonist [Clostridium sp. CAG:793]
MISTYSKEGKVLTFKLTEEIDQHTADKIRRKVDGDIERFSPRKVIFDFSDILFMDSSGIGMVLGRYKLVKLLGGQFEIINVKKRLKRIFDMSGVSRIIPIQMDEEENNEGII